ncbi:restriction endonuclease subunit S, partial [Escherichia coli]|nr:restriction endonuclease subunit S [Escherichia coli]
SEILNDSIASTGFTVLRAKNDLSDFIYYFTLSKQFTYSLTNLAVGTSFPAVNDADVHSQKMVIPPSRELGKYKDILHLAENSYREAKSRLQKIRKLKSSYLNILLRGQ